ncbi:MAG: type II toxin-antitoxin system VapC family toxin [Bryobacteraceae bacterium]
MNLLLDTHVLIWWMEKSPRLGIRARETLLGTSTRPVVSAVSIWEISIKAAIGRLDMADPPETWVPRLENEWGVRSLPITFDHATAVRRLPPHHNDPFDRMLVAQAQCENLTLVTVDPAMAAYDVRTIDARI